MNFFWQYTTYKSFFMFCPKFSAVHSTELRSITTLLQTYTHSSLSNWGVAKSRRILYSFENVVVSTYVLLVSCSHYKYNVYLEWVIVSRARWTKLTSSSEKLHTIKLTKKSKFTNFKSTDTAVLHMWFLEYVYRSPSFSSI